MVARARALVQGCGCRHGCPACVGPILASDSVRGHSPKAAALRLLALLGGGAAGHGHACKGT